MGASRTIMPLLTWLMNFRNTEGQVARWIQRLNEYYLTSDIVKAPRMEMLMPFQEDHAQKNCRHCSRVETKYDYAIRQ
ncbi:hypothetical protein TNCV_1747191 [Trichonephila clavipes]|nr:hypothetical protein TNCV_1747191 [Trichonephila clavipes]